MNPGRGKATRHWPILDRINQQLQARETSSRKPKIKEPAVFRGERTKLRECLAQMKVYFRLVGWAEGHDSEEIIYTTSLEGESAGTWICSYIEDLKQTCWNTVLQFAEELCNQFGIIDK